MGAINTAIDFGALFALSAVGVPLIVGNTISTGAALIFSFFANRSYTFKTQPGGSLPGMLSKFLVVTLIGLWALQPIALMLVMNILRDSVEPGLALFFAKVLATFVSMTWNYVLYDRFVFRRQERN